MTWHFNITSSVKDMEIQPNDLNKESKKIRLKIHKGKTNYITNFQSDKTIGIENETINKVDRYTYIGQTEMMDKHGPQLNILNINS